VDTSGQRCRSKHVNKNRFGGADHPPSHGIVVQCQNERSQHKNKATALKLLRRASDERELKEKEEKLQSLHSAKKRSPGEPDSFLCGAPL
jgi:peptide chain release factor 2